MNDQDFTSGTPQSHSDEPAFEIEAEARVLALRNSLVEAGLDPFTVEYDDANDQYDVQPMMPFSSEAFEEWAASAGYRIVDVFRTVVGATYTLESEETE